MGGEHAKFGRLDEACQIGDLFLYTGVFLVLRRVSGYVFLV